MSFNLVKMQGCGNDFLFLDSMNSEPPRLRAREVQYLCDRHFGVGADGVVVMRASEVADAGWNFYNSDGSEAQMCGNAARCALKFLNERYFPGNDPIALETKAGIIKGRKIETGQYEITLIAQKDFKFDYTERILEFPENVYQVYLINTGVPHAVIEVNDLLHYPVARVGHEIQSHAIFKAEGTNVTFFQRLVGKNIRATTYERGVWEETLACGTGAAAAAIIFYERYLEPFPTVVRVPGGELTVDMSPVSRMLLLQGPAEQVYEVTIGQIPTTFEPTSPYGRQKGKA